MDRVRLEISLPISHLAHAISSTSSLAGALACLTSLEVTGLANQEQRVVVEGTASGQPQRKLLNLICKCLLEAVLSYPIRQEWPRLYFSPSRSAFALLLHPSRLPGMPRNLLAKHKQPKAAGQAKRARIIGYQDYFHHRQAPSSARERDRGVGVRLIQRKYQIRWLSSRPSRGAIGCGVG